MTIDPENSADTPVSWPRVRAALPYVLAAGLFALGLWTLYRLLAPVNLADVAAQVRATPWTRLALALMAVASVRREMVDLRTSPETGARTVR